MGCSQGLAKIFLFVVNFLFLLVGLALLIVGILYKVNLTKYTDAIPSEYQTLQNVPILAIVVGSAILVISFLGCCGALKNNTCMLSWYGGILITIFLLQVGLGIYAFVLIKDVDDLESKIKTQIDNIFATNTSGIVDVIQENFQCCGTYGPDYWTNKPASCLDSAGKPFETGCRDVVATYISGSIKTIAIIALAVSAVEVLGAVLALCLNSCIRQERQGKGYY